jgi:ribonucleoside-diphosphate reductase beta chain
MKNVYSDPAEVFDTILEDKEILKRAKTVTENYDKFNKMALDYTVKGKGDIIELKRALYLAMVTVNLLEGLRFYISFACTFAFGELKLMEGSAKILSLIARDEATHLNLSTHVIKAWQKNDERYRERSYTDVQEHSERREGMGEVPVQGRIDHRTERETAGQLRGMDRKQETEGVGF